MNLCSVRNCPQKEYKDGFCYYHYKKNKGLFKEVGDRNIGEDIMNQGDKEDIDVETGYFWEER